MGDLALREAEVRFAYTARFHLDPEVDRSALRSYRTHGTRRRCKRHDRILRFQRAAFHNASSTAGAADHRGLRQDEEEAPKPREARMCDWVQDGVEAIFF